MASSTTARAREVIAELDQFEVDMHLVNQWVHGADNLTVLLGGVSTPTIKNLVKNFRMSAQEILDAADYIQDNYEGLEDIIDANREYAEIAETLLLKIATWMARDLAEFNAINIDRYNVWYAHGIERIEDVGREAEQCVQNVRDLIDAFDESYAQHRLQIRLFDGTNPGTSSKPVLFVISGQSNASGGGKYTPFERGVDCGQFWEWCAYPGGVLTHLEPEDQSLKPLADPVGEGNYGSGWVPFARKFFQYTGRKVILLNIASSGSTVTDGGYTTTNTWADNGYGTLRTSRTALWNAFSAAVPASSYDLGGILWLQGENEVGRMWSGRITLQDYIDGTLDVWSWTRSLVGNQNCPIFVGKIACFLTSIGNSFAMNLFKEVQDQQEKFCDYVAIFPGYFATPDFKNCPDLYYSDSAHYSAYGYKMMGEGFARNVAHYLNF